MKILIVNRFFGGAQIPTGRMAEDVARVLVEEGHEVVALASSGEYAGAVAQARDQETKRPKDEETVGGRRPETGGPSSPEGLPSGLEALRAGSGVGERSESEGKEHGTLRVEEVRVPKWMPRALAWLWFTWQARKRIPRMDWDVCVLMTDPPLLPLLAARVKARGQDTGNRGQAEGIKARGRVAGNRRQSDDSNLHSATAAQAGVTTKRQVAVWLMDLYPEALAASGRVAKSSAIYKWYFSKRQHSLAAAQLLICLGETQRKRLETKRPKDEKPRENALLTERVRTAVVPPWDDREEVVPADDRRLENLALYAGNLGEAHAFVDLLRAVPFLPNEWKLRFAVRGAKSAALRKAVEESGARDRVIVSGYVSADETAALLASARVHLITMSPGWEGIVVPSKLYGCIRTGRPVLFVGPEKADTAREILVHDWGKVLPPGASGEEVAGAILELAARPTRVPQLQHGAREVAGELAQLAEGDR